MTRSPGHGRRERRRHGGGTHVIVDAYNALYRLLGDALPEDRDAARRALVDLAQRALRGRGGGGRVHLVFDTSPGAERAGRTGGQGGVAWTYAVGSADDAIVELVRRREDPPGRTPPLVVTDDRELSGRVRQLGARTAGVSAFFANTALGGGESGPGGGVAFAGDPDFGADDFGLPDGPIDLDAQDPFEE